MTSLTVTVPGSGDVSALFLRPPSSNRLLVVAHGAGAGMSHPSLDSLCIALGAADIATFRYQFPYMENGTGRPDLPAVATATVAAAVRAARAAAPDLPIYAGGRSFGGRMTSQAAAKQMLPDVKGLVFFAFPLHPPKRPGTSRADHLASVEVPMLFLQGTRDELAELDLLRPICERLVPLATLHIIEGADHSFHVLKRSGRTDAEVLQEVVSATARHTLPMPAATRSPPP